MRLFLIATMSVLAGQASTAAEPRVSKLDSPKTDCRTTIAHPAGRQVRAGPYKLADLPAANVYAAVVRTVDGCGVPLILTRVPKSR